MLITGVRMLAELHNVTEAATLIDLFPAVSLGTVIRPLEPVLVLVNTQGERRRMLLHVSRAQSSESAKSRVVLAIVSRQQTSEVTLGTKRKSKPKDE